MREKQGTPSWKKVHEREKKKEKICNAEEEEEQEEEEEDDDDDDDKDLALQFKNLQQYWGSLQPNNPTRIPRCYSSDTNFPVGKSLQCFNNSPPKLMTSSSLRRKTTTTSSPLEGVWKVRTNELAVEEIMRERKAAIESGRLKGRRLFMEGATEMDLGYSDWSDLVQDNGKKSVSSSSVSSASTGSDNGRGGSNCCCCSECGGCGGGGGGGDMERKKGVVVMEENVVEKKTRWRVFKGMVCIALVVFILCFILLGIMNGDGDGNEAFLVPT